MEPAYTGQHGRLQTEIHTNPRREAIAEAAPRSARHCDAWKRVLQDGFDECRPSRGRCFGSASRDDQRWSSERRREPCADAE